jgi:hypothetical protein
MFEFAPLVARVLGKFVRLAALNVGAAVKPGAAVPLVKFPKTV